MAMQTPGGFTQLFLLDRLSEREITHSLRLSVITEHGYKQRSDCIRRSYHMTVQRRNYPRYKLTPNFKERAG